MDVIKFVSRQTNTCSNMWILKKETNTKDGVEYDLSCSTGKEVVLKVFEDKTFEMVTYGDLKKYHL